MNIYILNELKLFIKNFYHNSIIAVKVPIM